MSRRYLDPHKSIIPVSAILFGPGGKCLIKMALDTGATYTLISPEAAGSLGYALDRRLKTVPITTPSRTETVSLIRVQAIQCMGKQLRDIDVICHTLPKKAIVDGLLGLNFLNKFNLSLFFKDHFMEIR